MNKNHEYEFLEAESLYEEAFENHKVINDFNSRAGKEFWNLCVLYIYDLAGPLNHILYGGDCSYIYESKGMWKNVNSPEELKSWLNTVVYSFKLHIDKFVPKNTAQKQDHEIMRELVKTIENSTNLLAEWVIV